MSVSESFCKAALGAVHATRLFVDAIHDQSTTFQYNCSSDSQTLAQTIRYHSHNAWGEIIRDNAGLSISVIPAFGLSEEFVARRLTFNRNDFGQSIMTTIPNSVLAEAGGRHYAMAIATLFLNRLKAIVPKPFEHDGIENLLISAPLPGKIKFDQVAFDLAQNLTMWLQPRLQCYLRYPALDQPGAAYLVDQWQNVSAPPPEFEQHFDDVMAAAACMPNALRFTLSDKSFPPAFTVSPIAYTVAPPVDVAQTVVAAVGAVEQLAIHEGNAGLFRPYETTVSLSLTGRENAYDLLAQAQAQMLHDWRRLMEQEPLPQLGKAKVVARINDKAKIRLRMLIEPDAAERYNERGKYKLAPANE